MSINLTSDQIKVIDSFNDFIDDPHEDIFMLDGFPGTGKSTLTAKLNDLIATRNELNKVTHLNQTYTMYFTATTNPAVEALKTIIESYDRHISAMVSTVYSFLGYKVSRGNLVKNLNAISKLPCSTKANQCILLIDEFTYLDAKFYYENLLPELKNKRVKLVLLGDFYQLLSPTRPLVKSRFIDLKYYNQLTENKRVEDPANPIPNLCNDLRKTIDDPKTYPLTLLLEDTDFTFLYEDEEKFKKEITYSNIVNTDKTKALAFKNSTVVELNNMLLNDPFTIKYLVSNSFLKNAFRNNELLKVNGITKLPSNIISLLISTDKFTVEEIKTIHVASFEYYPNTVFSLNHEVYLKLRDFMYEYTKSNNPFSLKLFAYFKSVFLHDLRLPYAQTIHKSQGATYEEVFFDARGLDNLNDEFAARLLLVAISRVSKKLHILF